MNHCLTVTVASAWNFQAADDAKFMPSLVEATFLPWDVHPRKAKEIMMLQRFVFAVRTVSSLRHTLQR
eukprot:COSAG06_NODE_36779_length_443_cov_0.595930_1_plen_67_part_10